MFHLDLINKYHIDFGRFEKLLRQVSIIVNLTIEIKANNGESMVRACNRPDGMGCDTQGGGSSRCHAESSSLFRRIEKSGKSEVQKCCDSVDIIGIPLICRCKQDMVGILFACSGTGAGNISNEVKEFLEELAERISGDIQNQTEIYEFTQELSEKYEELNLVYDIGKNLGGITSAHKAITYIAEQAKESLDSDMVMISVPGDLIYKIHDDKWHSLPKDMCDAFRLKEIEEAVKKRLTSPEISPAHIVLNDVRDDAHLAHLSDVPMGLLVLPVKLKGSVAGFLCIINFDMNRSFQTSDVSLTTSLAQQISLSLTNTELYQDMKDFMLSVIKTLVFSIEAKDAYTKGHSERVNGITMEIAELMELSAEDKESLNLASMLHDIGKIGVPGSILTKPGKLTGEEWIQIKEHPEKGYRILLPIGQLKDSLMGIRYHHERYDGTGYPSGLRGEEIPLYARIIAVADTYDAMTSTRSYRAKKSDEEALAEIIRAKGIQLDPEIVNIFLKLHEMQPPACNVQYQNKI